MSSYNILYVHQSEGVKFDAEALNKDLDKNYWDVSELWNDYSDIVDHPKWEGWIRLNDGQVEIAQTVEHYFGGYGDECVVYGCFGMTDAKRIASHLTAGKLVFRLEYEGGGGKIFIITPGKAETVEPSEVKY